jgi:glycosyltransferase involved in cell wall biosynthesis
MQNLISVIVPNLNEEKALPYFLRSLNGQIFRRFELVVVDGGSRDGSVGIIDQYSAAFPIQLLVDYTKNLGYIRNLGAESARGDLLFFTNSDAVLPYHLLSGISYKFSDPRLLALSGRTVPYQGGSLAFAAYYCFDMIRSFMANYAGRFSPSGNFLAIRKDLFWRLRGFPKAPVNEDGLLGQKISQYSRSHGGKARFEMGMSTGHFAKRFKKGPFKTLMFYSYVFGNFSPVLARMLAPVERSSREVFKRN